MSNLKSLSDSELTEIINNADGKDVSKYKEELERRTEEAKEKDS